MSTKPAIGPEWTRADAPAVSDAAERADAERRCSSCGCWSQWLGQTGDCLYHATRRREAMIAAESEAESAAVRQAWPRKSARMTAADEVCSGWMRIRTR